MPYLGTFRTMKRNPLVFSQFMNRVNHGCFRAFDIVQKPVMLKLLVKLKSSNVNVNVSSAF